MTITQIESNIIKLLKNFTQDTFIFEFLLVFGEPKATLTRLQKSDLNNLESKGEVLLRKKVFFKEVYEHLHGAIDTLKNDIGKSKQKPRFIIVTDYKTLLAYDSKTTDTLDINFKDLAKHYDFFLPLAGMEKSLHVDENPADVRASNKLAKLYDEILKVNPTSTHEEVHALNVFLTRLLFCYFAEDSNIFENNLFTDSIASHTQVDGSDLTSYLERLFDVFNQDENSRDNSLPQYLKAFPYNKLFQFMNDKINVNYHYNADASRELISLIDNEEQLYKELKNSKYSFNIDESYLKIISDCNNFLVGSGGSPIPEDMGKLNIIESIPIFYMNNKSPINESIIFDEEHIHAQWKKALERKKNDPEGAITTARALIESILKYILDEKKITYNENSDLSEIYKEVAKSLNLAPEQHQEQIFKQILGGANGIISGLGSLRNKLGDAHGKTKISIKPRERHSELAVNLAASMAMFLYKTFKEQNHE